jgi:hypothetical protein
MKIDCYLSKQCASEHALRQNLSQALFQEGTDAEVTFYRISDTEAEKLGVKGSPSILINGSDIQPVDMQGFS